MESEKQMKSDGINEKGCDKAFHENELGLDLPDDLAWLDPFMPYEWTKLRESLKNETQAD